jgi:UV DNA damage repair endonuclease
MTLTNYEKISDKSNHEKLEQITKSLINKQRYMYLDLN